MFYLFKQTITNLEINKSQLELVQDVPLRYTAQKFGPFLYALGFLSLVVSWKAVSVESFDIASSRELARICNSEEGFPDESIGAELAAICGPLGAAPTSTGVGSQSQPNSILISQQQLKNAKSNKENGDVVPGGSADVLTAQWGDKLSTFLTVGATTLRHRNNAFEQGYTATIPSVTLGGGYLIAKNLETGLAFNYSNSDGDYNTGGGFEVDSYSPLLYLNYLPLDDAFTTLVLGYTRQNQAINRIAVANRAAGGVANPQSTNAEFSTNQYNLNFLSGYDFSVESFTIGPRVGVDARHWEMNAYQESTNTGLELSYNRQRQTSIQTTLGLFTSFAHSTASGIIIPQLSASWVHEFANDARTINAQFVQAPGSGFSFQTERPARNWAVIDLGVSFVMQNGIQAFVNFSTVQGNSNFESYGGNLGIKVGL